MSAAEKIELVALISGKTASESQQDLAKALDIKVKEFEKQRVQQDGSVRREFTSSEDLEEMIKRCLELTAHQISQQRQVYSLESMLKIVLGLYIDIHDGKSTDSAKIEKLEAEAISGVEKINKTITPKMRRFVLCRDKCCQHKDKVSGQKCGSKFALQVDHITAVWAGGSNSIENLQALCANHNQYKYRKEAQLRFG